MRNFKTWLTEDYNPSDYEGRTPHHVYHTQSGHPVHVHLEKDEHGTHAVFINKHLGGVVKTVHWKPDAEAPSKQELEKSSAYEDEEEDLHEELLSFKGMLIEKAPPKVKVEKPAAKETEHVDKNGNLTINAGGVLTEIATHYHLNEHKHKVNGTVGSKEHLAEQKELQGKINEIANHKNATKETKEQVQTRIYHGRSAAAGIIRNVRMKHGPKAKIINVGHTSKPGDISRFTRGVHNDTQENTSDVAVEIAGSHNKPNKKNSDGTHFEGFSLKSSKKSAEITAKNPAADMGGLMDHPTRKLEADAVGKKALDKHVFKPLGISGKTPAERSKILDQKRAEHEAAGGEKNKSEMELKANEGGKKAIQAQNNELHDHLKHLTSLPNGEGHKMIGKMLTSHLMPDTDMPNSKVKVSGEKKEKVKSVVEPNSDHPMKKIFSDPKTKFDVRKNAGGGAIHVGYVHPESKEFVHLATYAAKPKSNASKAGTMGWNIKAAKFH